MLPVMPELKTELMTLRVEPAIKMALKSRARARQMTVSELLRAVVLAEIGQGAASLPPTSAQPEKSVDTERITVRLARFLLDAVKTLAEARGMAPSRWIAALVQSHVTSTPVLADAELAALLAANRELVAVGRNLNQIARHLNDVPTDTADVTPQILEGLIAVIAADRYAVRALVRASRQAWGTNEHF